ncbi:hypothetical protein HPB47_002550 [Ixodes persulcatus]|uniref:Uncharacterized protein n=1 Tax=Ixodes persulcatus TaxID=34615 RepID=A0AC60PMI2_IXOPE|nr:hypothetical protein HPB47_002550 [Ixodes persulcatus]
MLDSDDFRSSYQKARTFGTLETPISGNASVSRRTTKHSCSIRAKRRPPLGDAENAALALCGEATMRRCGCSLRPWPRCAPPSEAGTALASSGLSRREGGAGDEGGLEQLPQPAREWASPGPEHGRTGNGTPGRCLCSRAPRRRATLNQGETPRGPLLSPPIPDSGRSDLHHHVWGCSHLIPARDKALNSLPLNLRPCTLEDWVKPATDLLGTKIILD